MSFTIETHRMGGADAKYTADWTKYSTDQTGLDEVTKKIGVQGVMDSINGFNEKVAQGQASGKKQTARKKVLDAAMKDPEIQALLKKRGAI